MKTKKVILTMVFVVIGIFTIKAENVISLSEAIQKKWVKVVLKGTGYVGGLNNSSHQGKCIKIKITNISGIALKIQLKAGQFLQPDDSATQRMLVTNSMMFALNNGAFKNDYITAFCSQMSSGAPEKDLNYAVSSMSRGNIYDLAQIVDKYDFVSNDVQSAIWAFTDNYRPNKLMSADTFENRILNTFLADRNVLLIEPPKQELLLDNDRKSSSSATVNYDLNLGNRYNIQVTVTDENGKIVQTLYPSPKHFEPGNHHLEIKLNSAEIPEGTYMVRLLMNGSINMQKRIKLGNSGR